MKDSTEKFDIKFDMPKAARALRPCVLMAALMSASLLTSSALALAQNAAPQPLNGPVVVPAAPAAPAPAASGFAAPGQQPPQANGAFPNQPPPPAAEKPGFIYAFGRWWDDTRGKIGDLSKQQNGATGNPTNGNPTNGNPTNGDPTNGAAAATQDVLKGAAEATKNAANAIVRLPTARFVEGHQRCAVAPNGAPDCRTAAANVCRSKGFKDGQPLNVQSSQDCPPAVWMSGREPAPGECPEETVVLMAACN